MHDAIKPMMKEPLAVLFQATSIAGTIVMTTDRCGRLIET